MTIWQPGHRLAGGKYTIERLLGEGGFCVTYQARDTTDRPVAIQTLNTERSQARELNLWQQHLANTALRLAHCHHRHIVAVEEFVLDGLRWCVVLEYLPGGSLDTIVERDGVLPVPQAIAIVEQIGSAVALIHDRGLLHRDIKPLNILTRHNGEAVLIDFGLASPFQQDVVEIQEDYTSRGFAPIEQYDRRAKRGAYTDVYGLAATLYFLVTGEIPRSPLTRIRDRQNGRPDPLVPPSDYCPDLRTSLEAAILNGLALQPEDRPPTIAAWFDQLGLEPPAPATQSHAATPPPEPRRDPQTEAYASAIGLRFEALRSALETGRWQDADRETDRLLQIATGVKSGAPITIEDIENIPGRDLRTIASLWNIYSSGRFGLAYQARLWRSLNQDSDRFAAVVGWSVQGRWRGYGELSFRSDAPAGHLPTWGRRGKLWATLCDRLEACHIGQSEGD
ncbi:MAG: serine/threonine protein kinase [Oscillatoriales cyanobacterium]|nr:MAG: serine/threonine protein kinase [Oscillatoriales cyanobacterium]